VALLPFCACMGATFPLAMAALRRSSAVDAARSFSYLYFANVVGATLGTLLSAFVLIELLGFQGTLRVAAALNTLLAACALALSFRPASLAHGGAVEARPSATREAPRRWLLALFATGLVTMAMEIVWVRLYTAYLGNVVYAFATILAVYLCATFVGSHIYRRLTLPGNGRAGSSVASLWAWAGFASLLPLVACDPRIPFPSEGLAAGALRVGFGLGPLSLLMGVLTPMLVDRWSGGDPDRAGRAYAVNVVGCILGPLVAGFGLVPLLGERWALLVLALPLFALAVARPDPVRVGAAWPRAALLAPGALALFVLFSTRDHASLFENPVVRRDSTATVIAAGEGLAKKLLVNGVGMTHLTPITKMMAHLPLASLEAAPRRGLTICLGMGTSFRSLTSWGISSTAVELVPSVAEALGYFHPDAPRLLRSPLNRVLIDDGRRFLERSGDDFDVIVVDPPPPVEAAGSSLLYSVEFCDLVRRRLGSRGILQHWIPGGEAVVVAAFVGAVRQVFPHVRAFRSLEGWGLHILASAAPIPRRTAGELASRLPPGAVRDLIEWGPATTAEAQFALVVAGEVPVDTLGASPAPAAPLRDERPINEYYLLRRTLGRHAWARARQ
jgi:spermidine synthase